MVDRDTDRQLQAIDGEITQEEANTPEYTPIYSVYPNSKVPVSKHVGPMWRRRRDEGLAALKRSRAPERWDEAISYYQNSQDNRRDGQESLSSPGRGSKDSRRMYGTENIVFANVSALIPVVYAKNPDISITTNENGKEAAARMYERLIDELMRRKMSPGINLKPKMRRGTVMTMLTNIAYYDISYTVKENSSQAAVDAIVELSEAYQNVKNSTEIAEIEGKLLALDEKVNLLSESGPKLRVRHPKDVITDPNGEEADLTDSNFVMIADYPRTSFIRAMYAQKNEDGKFAAIYDPTHVLTETADNSDIKGHDDEINSFTLLGEEDKSDYAKFGFESEEAFNDSCRTKVWMVWDKITRRVLMFHDKDWSVPIWVWDDPYNLPNFYPLVPMTFYTDPVDRYARSEIMYYLDQQDEINRINNELARIRHWASSKIFVNTTVLKDVTQVQEFLTKQGDDIVHGVNLPDGVKLQDAISTVVPPSAQYEQLFNTDTILNSINRMSSVTPLLQNQQFKTNTTNKAIETYESTTQTRLDEKIDAIEDAIAAIGTTLIEMCVQFMTEEEVIDIVGHQIVEAAGGWETMTPAQFHKLYNFTIAGGSTLKPTSKAKKEQAINLSQVLGQFASASPVGLLMALKALKRAFEDDVVLTDEEWSMIVSALSEAINPPQAAPSANGGGRPPSGEQQQEASGQQGNPAEQVMMMIDEMIQTAPPEIRSQIAEQLTTGVPLGQVVRQFMGQ